MTLLPDAVAAVVVTTRAAPECHTACGKSSRMYLLPAVPVALVRKHPPASSLAPPGAVGYMSNLHVLLPSAWAVPPGASEAPDRNQ